jgi:hypothetical protein|uniref:Uncharacterized protein n=1 Tax=Sipha flava TaxID=143950 RepID=A0A2S2QRR2_9HEMI
MRIHASLISQERTHDERWFLFRFEFETFRHKLIDSCAHNNNAVSFGGRKNGVYIILHREKENRPILEKCRKSGNVNAPEYKNHTTIRFDCMKRLKKFFFFVSQINLLTAGILT